MKGKLIVIEGLDSSGKATQTKLLVKRLKKEGMSCTFVSFPRYYSSFYGQMVARYLRGEFGKINTIHPYLASLLYTWDRYFFKEKLKKWLQQGKIVIADRYTTANMLYQGAKLKSKKEKDYFLKWLSNLEYKIHGLPLPDKVIYLYVLLKIVLQWKKKKGKRRYLKNKKDIHEINITYLRKVEAQALVLAKKYRWSKIDCIKKGHVLSKKEVAEEVWKIVKKII